MVSCSKDLFPTKLSFVYFISYMGLFINQGKLICHIFSRYSFFCSCYVIDRSIEIKCFACFENVKKCIRIVNIFYYLFTGNVARVFVELLFLLMPTGYKISPHS